MGAKAVIRDVVRVLGMPFADVDRIAKLVPGFPLNITLDDAYQKSPPLAEIVKSQSSVKELWDIARALEGCTRHASVHASAVVISDEPLDQYVPLYKDPKRPELITGYAMGPIEKLGLLKMDFLGLRTLTVLANTAKLLKESRGIEIDFDALPLDDAKTYAGLAEAKTFGVFQLESSGMREALRGLKPGRLEDVIAMVSLYRPGPMDLIPDFIARKHGRAKITYEHPAMEKFTRETYGIMVYQEQIMQIASEMGGFTMGEADTLRRAMGKKDRELMAKQRDKFLAGCVDRGTQAGKAERVWELMEKFAGYGFNKCLTADTWIEMANGTRKPITAVREGDLVLTKDGAHRARAVTPSGVRRVGRLTLTNGLSVRCTPDHPIFTHRGWVNAEKLAPADGVGVLDAVAAAFERVAARRSGGARAAALAETPMLWAAPVSFVLEGTEPTYDIEVPGAGSFIANGIAVHNSHAGAYALVAYQTAYFKANYPVEFLVKAGAFDSLGLPRAHLLAQTDVALEGGQRVQRDRLEGQASFFDALIPPAAAPAHREPAEIVAEWPDDQRLAYEKEVLGFYISGHPLAQYAAVIESLGVTTSADLAARSHGARVTLLGHVAALKEAATKSGSRMAFVTLEDMAGAVEVTVFPEPFKTAAPFLRSREPLVVRGRVDDGDKGRVILAEDVRLLEQALGGAPRPRAAGAEPGACRIRVVAGGDPESRLAALRKICEAHPGGVPVFVHVVLAGQEVVIRSRGFSVDATPELVSEVEGLLGRATLTIDYA